MRSGKLGVICFLASLFVAVHLSGVQCEEKGVGEEPIPEREVKGGIVSLDSSITEIVLALGAGEFLKGITIHDVATFRRLVGNLPGDLAVVGSFFAPDTEKIAEIFAKTRGVIFVHGYHKWLEKDLSRYGRVLSFNINSPEELYEAIRAIGFALKKREKAEGLIAEIKDQIEIISRKTSTISQKKRVLRFMGRKDSETVYVPGDDSFQNLLIRLAGGVPPSFGKKGPMVPITVDEWKSFNPQVIYGCGNDREVAEKFFKLPGWKDVDALKKGHVHYFPCDLTCRFSINSGLFVQWLASTIYREEFSRPEGLVEDERVLKHRPISTPIQLDYVASAEIVDSRIYDFHHKTLLIRFSEPLDVMSTLEGPRKGIQIVGNSFSPPPCWDINHALGFEAVKKHTFEVLGLDPERASLLYTGADMDNLSVQKTSRDSLVVYAIATAGVRGNALRASRDEGSYEEPGTINIIIMTNRSLSPAAMSRAIVTATEAKTAALQDLDIRSTYHPSEWQATGTGTDEIIVVSGKGPAARFAGGHTRLGQLIADAVYRAVLEAVRKQNGITLDRTVIERLEERGIELYRLEGVSGGACSIRRGDPELMRRLYRLLMAEPYASLLNGAFALNDLYLKTSVKDLTFFERLCYTLFPSASCKECSIPEDALPPGSEPLRRALDAVLRCAASPACFENPFPAVKEAFK